MTERQLKAKVYLEQLAQQDKIIKSCHSEIEYLRELSIGISSTQWDKTRVQVSQKNEAMFASVIERIEETEARISDELIKMLDAYDNVRQTINLVNSRNGVLLLRLRYVEFKRWFEIQDALDKSEKQVFRIHADALNEVADILEARQAA